MPVDVVKERLQVQSNRTDSAYKGSIDAFRTIIKQEGLRGLYKGYSATLFSYGPFSATYFLLYEEVSLPSFQQILDVYNATWHEEYCFFVFFSYFMLFCLSTSTIIYRQKQKWRIEKAMPSYLSKRTLHGMSFCSCFYVYSLFNLMLFTILYLPILLSSAFAGSVASFLTNPLDLAKLR